ncbi:MAG: hypothetical protein M3347_10050, partial [Armatimonadota bacterium]|nr:hypothetical protein [Armatimonadota bacterium]
MFERFSRIGFLLLAVTLACSLAAADPAANYVWIEAENGKLNIQPNVAGWGRPELLSEGKWLHYAVDANKVEKEVPADGGLLEYKFTIAKAGKQEIWNRIGFEFVRSPFEWRVDNGDWTRVTADELTTDLTELATWTEVAWLKLGERDLPAGEHTLQIRLPKTKNEKGETQRILYASDAVLIYPGTFYPNGKYKPDENYRDAQDEAATKNVFLLPEPKAAGERAAIPLNGLWEVCRNDEQTPPFNVAQPMQEFPAQPHWKAIPVPSDKNKSRPDLIFAHRLWYRTRVNVPASQNGRSFFIHFPQNNLNTTVYVNGTYCGFNKNPFAPFSIDVTKGIKPGQVNEVWVGIRDAWYGYSTNPKDPMKLRRKFNLPLSFASQGWQQLAYPVWDQFQSGILSAPTFVAAGPVYTADVFVKPSVAKKQLEAEITLANPSGSAASGEIAWQAINVKTGAVEKSFASNPFTVAAGQEAVVNIADGWDNPKLWWPEPNPELYNLRATLRVNGQPVDTSDTRFGFREWDWSTKDFKLNGVKWHGWADTHRHNTKEEWIDFYRKTNQRFMRLWKNNDWYGLKPEEALDWLDEQGVVVRRSGIMDGQAIGPHPGEPDEDLRKLYKELYPNYVSDIKLDLAANWKDQMVALVKGERNHPAIHIWSIENEWLYIAVRNTGAADKWEPVVTDVSRAVTAADPTRPNMTDGGGATKDQTLPVHGDHYVFGGFTDYPEKAYQPNPTGGGRERWEWDMKRPRYIGEDVFAEGHNPDYAYFGGEQVFLGQQASKPAVGRAMNILTQGYRWAEYGAWHLWQGQHVAVGQYDSNAPLAVFCRQWDWTFGSGQKVPRTFGIFNDTFHTNEPIAFTRT